MGGLEFCKHCSMQRDCWSCEKLEDWVRERVDIEGDLISRETLRGKVRALKRETEPFRNCSYKTGYISALSTIEGLLAHMEAVDAEPVRHGRMSKPSIKGVKPICLECHIAYVKDPAWNYCPYCGAKMDTEGN